MSINLFRINRVYFQQVRMVSFVFGHKESFGQNFQQLVFKKFSKTIPKCEMYVFLLNCQKPGVKIRSKIVHTTVLKIYLVNHKQMFRLFFYFLETLKARNLLEGMLNFINFFIYTSVSFPPQIVEVEVNEQKNILALHYFDFILNLVYNWTNNRVSP